MITNLKKNDPELLKRVQYELQTSGFCVIENVLDKNFLAQTKEQMYLVKKRILEDIGGEKLARAKEAGVLRLMMNYSPHFFEFLKIDTMRQVIDAVLAPTAVMHLQNGFVLPSSNSQEQVFQFQFHRDFPRLMNSYLCSINFLFAIDEFRDDNGATLFLPGTQQREVTLTKAIEASAVRATCEAGSVVIFDSTLIHAAGPNSSGQDRLAINHQFTRSYFKQQVDYVRAIGVDKIKGLDERTKQLLGWYTRIPTSLQEYYVAPDERLYRGGQG